ncbi:LysE family translocator [Saccharicrinis fermentans]|nr:LysE family translocator [Saccharicrinis fermentans]
MLLTIMPGPDNIFVLTESMTKGYRNGIAVSIGLCCGILIHTIAATTGVSIIIQKSAMAFAVLKYMGAAYLFYLAYQSLREKKPTIHLEAKEGKGENGFWRLLRKGLLMNVLNPKVVLFFMALLPQFVVQNSLPVGWQMMVLGAVFMVQALVIFSLISILSGRLSTYLNNSQFWKVTKYSKVSVLGLLGLGLMLAKR